MTALEAKMMYDAAKGFAKDYGIDTDKGVKSFIRSKLEKPFGNDREALLKAWDDAQISDEELEDAMRSIPYEEGDFEEIYEDDLNDDGDPDVTAMDTTGDGQIDTVVTTSDSDKEAKDAEKEAKDLVGDGDVTSVGKDESELTENTEFPKDHNSDSLTGGKSEPLFGGQTWKDLLSAIMEQRTIS